MMDPIKEAFSKIKDDISNLKDEVAQVKNLLSTLQNQTDSLQTIVKEIQQTDQQTHNQTHNSTLKAPYYQNSRISIGNDRVPTDRPTNQQTDQQTGNAPKLHVKDPIEGFKQVNEVLSTLDSIKKEIRLKFKGLTRQEMVVFSTLYSLEDQNIEEITYKTLAVSLKLSESSIRDYINKLINKGIPISKLKENNKTIHLAVSTDLKNITSLETIIELRDL